MTKFIFRPKSQCGPYSIHGGDDLVKQTTIPVIIMVTVTTYCSYGLAIK